MNPQSYSRNDRHDCKAKKNPYCDLDRPNELVIRCDAMRGSIYPEGQFGYIRRTRRIDCRIVRCIREIG